MAYLLALIFAFLMMTKMQLSSNALMMTDLFFIDGFLWYDLISQVLTCPGHPPWLLGLWLPSTVIDYKLRKRVPSVCLLARVPLGPLI